MRVSTEMLFCWQKAGEQKYNKAENTIMLTLAFITHENKCSDVNISCYSCLLQVLNVK
jgi:hypothetical protein